MAGRVKQGNSREAYEQRRELWVEAMIALGANKTKAAEAAGYKPGHSSEQAGQRLWKDPVARQMLKKRQGQVLKGARLTANETMASLARDVHFDPARLLNLDGTPKQLHEMDEDTRKALRGFKLTVKTEGEGRRRKVVGYELEVKFPEKTAAREQAMKHFGLYERDNKQKPFYVPPVLKVVGVPGRK